MHGLTVVGFILLFFFSPLRTTYRLNLLGLNIQRLLFDETPLLSNVTIDEEANIFLPRLSIIHYVILNNLASAESSIQNNQQYLSDQELKLIKTWISNWAIHLNKIGEIEQSERVIQLLQNFDGKSENYYYLSQFYGFQGKEYEAEQYLLESLAFQPNGQAYMQLGMLYRNQGESEIQENYGDAIQLFNLSVQAFESAKQIDPKYVVEANYHLGSVYWDLNRRHDAVHAYLEAADYGLSGNYVFLSWFYLGQIYNSWWNGGLDQNLARSYFDRAFLASLTDRDKAMSLTGIGSTYQAQGQYFEAIAVYRQALQYDPAYEPAIKAITSLVGE